MIGIKQTMNNKCTTVTMGALTLVFSYETLVAYHEPHSGWQVSENVWGPTTGRHIMGATGVAKEDRVPRLDFIANSKARFGDL